MEINGTIPWKEITSIEEKKILKKKIALKSCIVVCTNLFSLPFILLLMP